MFEQTFHQKVGEEVTQSSWKVHLRVVLAS